jgi:tRNA 2-thiouridine synthesizing protein A
MSRRFPETGAPLYGPAMQDEILVDARGHRCPVPTLRLRRALEGAPAGTRVRLLADDPLARIDVPHFAGEAGFEVFERGEDGATLSFLVGRP